MSDIDIIALLTRSGTYVLALAVFIVTWIVRKTIENIWPSLQKQGDANATQITYLTRMSRWWNEVMLYEIPVLIGGAFGFMHSGFLFGDITGLSTKMTFGGVVGWLASFMYKVLRKVVKQRLGVDILPGDQMAVTADPPPGTGP